MTTDNISLLNRAVDMRAKHDRMMQQHDAGYGAFDEHLKRMKEWDEETCPEEMKEVLNYVREHPEATPLIIANKVSKRKIRLDDSKITFLRRAVAYDRRFKKSIKRVNRAVEEFNNLIRVSEKNGFWFHTSNFAKEAYYHSLQVKGKLCRDYLTKSSQDLISRKDQLDVPPELRDLFSKIFMRENSVFGIISPKVSNCFNDAEGNYLLIGEEHLVPSPERIGQFGRDRFQHIFQTQPASDSEIIQTLRVLNDFPNDRIKWSLEERTLDYFPSVPKGVQIWYGEARTAQNKGLFSKVNIYELKGEKPDPVIVGIDHFDQKYPMIYWAGDEGMKKG